MVKFKNTVFLGGALKFLASANGIEAANVDHACVWYKCPKDIRSDMTKQWSNTKQDLAKEIKIGTTEVMCYYFHLYP